VSDLFERFGRNFPTGTVLFREGDPGEEMYVIQSGRVQLTRRVRGREAHLATLPTGEFFGEMAIVNNRPRSATATVLEESQLLVIDARTFEAMVRGNAEIALRFIKIFLRDGDSLVIAEVGKLDQFLEFLEMKENFGG